MNKNIVPQLSKEISYHSLNKNEFFIHQTQFDHRVKISKELYHFLQLIDSKQDLRSLVNLYNERHNGVLTIAFAFDFLFNKLAKFGIIESSEINIKPNTKPSYLKLNFIVINEKTVSKLTKYLKFLFLPKVIKAILMVTSIMLFASFYAFYNQILHTNIAKSEWLLLFFLSFVGVTFHEFGHASAAHYFGAKHGGIGGGFYLFMPVYFADVTDIWKLPKSQRIIVNLAGMYFELIYTIFLISIGLIFQNHLVILLACIYSISITHSLNPFARSDGYWILSDALEKPNLMQHGYLKLKAIFKSKISWKSIDYFLLFYGLISYSFILFFVYFVVIKNPHSILYFPQNLTHFVKNLFVTNSQFSLAELGNLFIPILFFYLLIGWIKALFLKNNK
ncbi:peptidase, M50 family protein [Flavobacterium gawalongense]|uniref:Peptidase, M50 family protein n=1 Tax=Flavobacterium gawalongense TaxID=2594432 RepID=A0A553BN44_9FLAO|nr:peptidase, M50 family protein [Flavobacterium gawalongense]TRX00154.1 peptidase, M50 family protein [Flavobacterium gawalongense]TRX04902.1 peptidase, M50 family protein [Flavobacterium gawalongense]TRX09680.1 peptidase, M50 family protein [Flavobacterium gawalongense]TRX10836.1 peptidase, M50 family protein [Flavobacterium gawalongense]TRX28085.1 peptidase, M50 family protein [Flavobacterium gawalongense]